MCACSWWQFCLNFSMFLTSPSYVFNIYFKSFKKTKKRVTILKYLPTVVEKRNFDYFNRPALVAASKSVRYVFEVSRWSQGQSVHVQLSNYSYSKNWTNMPIMLANKTFPNSERKTMATKRKREKREVPKLKQRHIVDHALKLEWEIHLLENFSRTGEICIASRQEICK